MKQLQVREVTKSFIVSKMKEWHCSWGAARARLGIIRLDSIGIGLYRAQVVVDL